MERAAQHLAALPDVDYYVNAGGDIALGFAGATSVPWRVGIEDPPEYDALLGMVSPRYGAVATSSVTYRGAHIVNPLTRTPATRFAAVTVTGPSLLWADVYATAAVASTLDAFVWRAGYEAVAVAGPAAEVALLCTPGWRFSETTKKLPR